MNKMKMPESSRFRRGKFIFLKIKSLKFLQKKTSEDFFGGFLLIRI